jgi:hypothetical protein
MTKPRGNLTKAVVLELVKDATPEKIEALFTSPKTNQVVPFASRSRTVEVLELTGAKKKAVEEYVYPTKRKSRKVVVKRGTDSKTVSKDDYKDLSNDKLISSIKEFKSKLKAMEEQLADRLK